MGLFNRWFKPKRPVVPVVPVNTPKIQILSGKGNIGDTARMLGVNIKTPELENSSGIRIEDSYLKDSYLNLYKKFIRKPNGSESYLIKSIDDKKVRYTIDTLLPSLPSEVGHDITWPPQLNIADIHQWVTPRLNRIAVFNEPPIHIGPSDEFTSVEDCTNKMIGVYNSVSADLKSKMFFHTGKPEVVSLSLTSPAGVKIHTDCLNSLQAAVASNKLPARIATTHKLDYGYDTDRLRFYRKLLSDYKSYFGNDVKLLFHEYKWMGSDDDTLDQILLVSEFWLIMSRIIFESNSNIEGGSYHCGLDGGSSNIFGLDIDREWTCGGMFNLWTLLSDIFAKGTYINTSFTNKPESVQVEAFEYGLSKNPTYVYVNTSANDVEIVLPHTAVNIKYIDSSLSPKIESFKKVLKAKTVGIIY